MSSKPSSAEVTESLTTLKECQFALLDALNLWQRWRRRDLFGFLLYC